MSERKRMDPIHPGEILLEDFMKPLGVSMNQLARDLDVPPNRISAIVNGSRSVTADTTFRLGLYFGVAAETWPRLQSEYDLRVVRYRDDDQIARRVRSRQAARAVSRLNRCRYWLCSSVSRKGHRRLVR